MPQRFLKPGIVSSIRLARCSPWAQLLYYKLISLVDDYSRFDSHPLAVSRAAFPYGDNHGRMINEEKIAAWLVELENARLNDGDEPCLTRYTADGKVCLLLHRWTERLKFQNGKYPGSRYPSPEKDVQVWEKLSNDVKERQRLSSPTTSPTTSSGLIKGGNPPRALPVQNGGADSRAQFSSVADTIGRLEKVKDRTLEQEERLKGMRRLRNRIQKKQAAGDFSLLEETET